MAPQQNPPRQPLGTLSTNTPRQAAPAPGPATPSQPPRRPRVHWSRYLETDYIRNTNNTNEPLPQPSSRVQREYLGIKPNPSGRSENDPYSTTLETFIIRCIGTGHVTTVHSAVVLPQSAWLREALARARRTREQQQQRRRNRNRTRGAWWDGTTIASPHDDDDDDDLDDDNPLEVRIPGLLNWHQIGWALEYMYTGQVPGFHTLTREEAHVRNPGPSDDEPARSVSWGLAQLWGAAAFLGLAPLARRAGMALRAYLRGGLSRAAAAQRLRRRWGGGARIPAGALRREVRFFHEMLIAMRALFRSVKVPLYDDSYMRLVLENAAGGQEWTPLPPSGVGGYVGAVQGAEVRSWERSIFGEGDVLDMDGEDEEAEDRAFEDCLAHVDEFRRNFPPMLVDLCMEFAPMGLFDVVWFQVLLSAAPPKFMVALGDRIREPEFWWLRNTYPDAPWSFEAREEGSLVSGMTGSSFQRR